MNVVESDYISLPPVFAPADNSPAALLVAARAYLVSAVSFLGKHKTAFDFNANNFLLSGDHFGDRLPAEWAVLALASLEQLCLVATGDDSDGILDTWPESLKDFVAGCRKHALPRRERDVSLFDLASMPRIAEPPDMFKGIPGKKVDEVRLLAPLVAKQAQSDRTVVDLGCGQGYLTGLLARGYGVDCLGVDFQTIQTEGAEKRKGKLGQGTGSLKFVCRRIDGDLKLDTLFTDDEAADDAGRPNSLPPPYILTGLHTCGDLFPTILRLFAASKAQSAVLVGCCYNLLTASGFPLSSYLASLDTSAINPRALNVACQNTEAWTDPVQLDLLFTRLWWRALLQKLAADLYPDLVCSQHFDSCRFEPFGERCEVHGRTELSVGRIRSALQTPTFEDYAMVALKRAKPAIPADRIPDRETLTAYHTRFQNSQPLFCAAWTLRALLGATIEGIILVERAVWCLENGIGVRVGAGWDAEKSPRNWVFVLNK